METLLDSHAAAHLLGMSVRSIERLRADGFGPRYIRLGKLVRFREADLAAYVDAQARDGLAASGNSEVAP